MGRPAKCVEKIACGRTPLDIRPGRDRPVVEALAITRALSDENRLRVLVFLGDGELCVCQIIEMLRLAPSTISEHMAVLHRAGLVQARKEGRWIYYRLAEAGASPLALSALRWIKESLAHSDRARNDALRLKAVKRTPVKELCKCYKV